MSTITTGHSHGSIVVVQSASGGSLRVGVGEHPSPLVCLVGVSSSFGGLVPPTRLTTLVAVATR